MRNDWENVEAKCWKIGGIQCSQYVCHSLIIFAILWWIWVLGLKTPGDGYTIIFLYLPSTQGTIFAFDTSHEKAEHQRNAHFEQFYPFF